MATRESIVHAAARVFDERGYAAASLGMILAEAGVAKGALYFHFDSKAALAEAVVGYVEQTWQRLRDRVDAAAADECWPQLERIHRAALGVAQECVGDVLVSAAVRLSDEWTVIATELPQPLQSWAVYVAEVVAAAQERGEADRALDAVETARVVVSSIYGIEHVSRRPGQTRSELPDRVEEWWRLTRPGLIPVSSPAPVSILE